MIIEIVTRGCKFVGKAVPEMNFVYNFVCLPFGGASSRGRPTLNMSSIQVIDITRISIAMMFPI